MLSHDPVPLLKKWDETGWENSNKGVGHGKTLLVSEDYNAHVNTKKVYIIHWFLKHKRTTLHYIYTKLQTPFATCSKTLFVPMVREPNQ